MYVTYPVLILHGVEMVLCLSMLIANVLRCQ